MIKLGFTLPNLANICLHKSIIITEKGRDLLEKIREDLIDGTSIVFTRKTVVDNTFRDSTICGKSIVGTLFVYVSRNANWSVQKITSRFGTKQN